MQKAALPVANAIVNAMTVDVEDYFHVAALAQSIDRSEWDSMEYRAEASTRRLLDLFDESRIRATFFVLGWVARRSPDLVREIQRRGHEVASHGMSHKLVFNQTPEEFSSETYESKALLEDITGQPVRGYRASTYSITKRSLWALDILHEAGFEYDSSIFPIRHDVYGIPDAPQVPSRIPTPKGASIVEFPMSTAPMFGTRVPVSGGGYFRLLPYWLTRKGLTTLNVELRRPFIFYLHPWEVDPEQPRVRTSWKSRFRHYTNLDRCEARLRRLIGEFRFGPVRDVLTQANLLDDVALKPAA
ncbi:MAG TPA: XrtA system polysaccharide deacetylase [Steroidobacteraceae bacterium]|nr:XrtA system polysaccharide deacetylase [Steroidobacteraceae bacterium]